MRRCWTSGPTREIGISGIRSCNASRGQNLRNAGAAAGGHRCNASFFRSLPGCCRTGPFPLQMRATDHRPSSSAYRQTWRPYVSHACHRRAGRFQLRFRSRSAPPPRRDRIERGGTVPHRLRCSGQWPNGRAPCRSNLNGRRRRVCEMLHCPGLQPGAAPRLAGTLVNRARRNMLRGAGARRRPYSLPVARSCRQARWFAARPAGERVVIAGRCIGPNVAWLFRTSPTHRPNCSDEALPGVRGYKTNALRYRMAGR